MGSVGCECYWGGRGEERRWEDECSEGVVCAGG